MNYPTFRRVLCLMAMTVSLMIVVWCAAALIYAPPNALIQTLAGLFGGAILATLCYMEASE